MITCIRCKQSKKNVEFNTLVRYQQPFKEAFTEFCTSCYWNQVKMNANLQEYLDGAFYRLKAFTERDLEKFIPLTIEQLEKPLLDWVKNDSKRELLPPLELMGRYRFKDEMEQL